MSLGLNKITTEAYESFMKSQNHLSFPEGD